MAGPQASFGSYVEEVKTERKKAHRSSVRLLVFYRSARAAGLIAAAVTPILAATHAASSLTASVAAFAAIAIGLVQLTAMQELSMLDRDRADALQHELRGFQNGRGRYEGAPIPSDLFFERVEAIRLDWQRRRRRLVKSTFRTSAPTDSQEGGPRANGAETYRGQTPLVAGLVDTDGSGLGPVGDPSEDAPPPQGSETRLVFTPPIGTGG